MGHWRRIDPSYTGKNRSGERVLKGITWVSEAIVGDNYLPLKPQTYIATPEDL
jgi:alkylated DNA repair dioxygenase AlkB